MTDDVICTGERLDGVCMRRWITKAKAFSTTSFGLFLKSLFPFLCLIDQMKRGSERKEERERDEGDHIRQEPTQDFLAY